MSSAEKFRRLFVAGLRSGQYEPWKSKINEYVRRVKTLDLFMAYLNAICDEFDPQKPPRSPGAKPSDPPKWKADSFGLAVAVLELLLKRGIEVSTIDNHIAAIIAEFAQIEAGLKSAAGRQTRLLIYASRLHAIGDIERAVIRNAAIKKLQDQELEYRNARFLTDDLARAYKEKYGKPHQEFAELYGFDPGDDADRTKFYKLAEACEKARKAALIAKDFGKACEALTKAFRAFQAYVRKEVQDPADMFRLLRWARQPGETRIEPMKNGGTNKVETAQSKIASQYFLIVKWELYLDIASYGLTMAMAVWKYDRALQAASRLRVGANAANWQAAWQSRATGFAGDDERYVYGPLPGDEPANLFRARLIGAQADPKTFSALQNQRRCMEVLAERRALKLVDEVKLSAMSAAIKETIKRDPAAVSRRGFELKARKHNYGVWRVGDGYPKAFSVYWIEPQRNRQLGIYIEFDRYPGYVFVSPPDYTIGDLVEAAQYLDIGESYEALQALAIAYLMVLGFALDVVSAGIAGNTLRGAVLHFLAERVAEKVVQKSLELAHLDHPLLQFVAGALVNAKLGKPRKLLSLDEIEAAERSVIRGTGRPARPALKETAKEATDLDLSKNARGIAGPASKPPGVGVTRHNDMLLSYEPSPTAYRDLPQPKRDTLIDEQLSEFADEEEKLLDRLTDPLNRMVAPQEVPAGMAPVLAGAGGGDFPDGILARVAGVAKSKIKGTAGRGKATRPTASQAKFSNSKLFKRLDHFNNFLTPDAKIVLQQERTAILQELGSGTISLKAARRKMMHVINLAKESFGELHGEMTARSSFTVTKGVTIPVRGDDGAPMLDWVGRLNPRSSLNPGKKFVVVEAKGGANTRLGSVSFKEYGISGKGQLIILASDNGIRIRQASAEWYYQKCAEIYMSGQRIAMADPVEAAARKKLALELFEASEKGEVESIITKFGMDDQNLYHNTDDIKLWFGQQTWDKTKGFPIRK